MTDKGTPKRPGFFERMRDRRYARAYRRGPGRLPTPAEREALWAYVDAHPELAVPYVKNDEGRWVRKP